MTVEPWQSGNRFKNEPGPTPPVGEKVWTLCEVVDAHRPGDGTVRLRPLAHHDVFFWADQKDIRR